MLEMQSPEEAAANSSSVTSLLRQFPSFLQSNPTSPLHASSGLDLSYKRDDDVDSIAESTKSGDNNVMDGDSNSEAIVTPQAPASSSRSRRKPAAPQWVRPEWNKAVPDLQNNSALAAAVAAAGAAAAASLAAATGSAATSADSGPGGDSNPDSGTINGVCVMNAFATESDGANAGSDQDIIEKD